MPSEFVLNIEKNLTHVIKSHFTNPYAKNIKKSNAFMKGVLKNYMLPRKDSMGFNRSYYMVDFNDFLDYATSELVKNDYWEIPEQNIFFYDALPGSFEEPFFDSEMEQFSIVGCALGRRKQSMTICVQVKLHGKDIYPEMIDHEFSRQLFSQEDAFHYCLCFLTLKQESTGDELV